MRLAWLSVVGEHHVAALNQCRDRADVRLEAGREDEGVLAALERGDPLLEPPVQVEAAGDQARGAGAGAVLAQGRAGAGHDGRVVGQPEVVVGGEQEMGHAVDRHLRVGRALAVGEHAQEVAVGQVGDRGRQPAEAGAAHPASAAATAAAQMRARSSSPVT